MMTTTTATPARLSSGRLPRFSAAGLFAASWLAMAGLFLILVLAGTMEQFSPVGTVFFVIALLRLVSQLSTVIGAGAARFDPQPARSPSSSTS